MWALTRNGTATQVVRARSDVDRACCLPSGKRYNLKCGGLAAEERMLRLLAHWVLSALCLLLVARFVPGIVVSGFFTALIAAVVIGLVNATLGFLLKIITFPLTIVTFGIFWFLINAMMLKFASLFVPGFEVLGLWPAFIGGLILSLLNMAVRALLRNAPK
jgi:putative membrane protein